MNGRTLMAAALALIVTAGAAYAHHSIGMIAIDSPRWVEATVVSYEPRDPHVLIHVRRRGASGQDEPLVIEGPILQRLERMHLARDFIKPGDTLRLCVFPFRKEIVAANASSAPGPAMHAQLLVLPDGRWQPWGPYGKFDNCVRPQDTPEQWAQFLQTQPMALEYWCKGLAYRQVATVATPVFVAAVNREIGDACDH